MNIPLTPIRFLHRARDQFGKKVAVVDDPESWTYKEYVARCQQLANLLRSWNFEPHSRVAFLSYNTHHLLEAYYGVILAGGIPLPLNIRLTPEDFSFILNDCRAEILFFHPDFAETVEQILPELPQLRKLVALEPNTKVNRAENRHYDALIGEHSEELEFDILGVDEDATAELFYTSGTTDRPKGVMLTHRNLYLHALEAGLSADARETDVQLHTIPLFHVNGWGTPQFLTCVGGRHVMLRKFDPKEVFQQIEEHKVTVFSLVPTMASELVNYEDAKQYDVSSVRMIFVGGSAANPHLVVEVEQLFGCRCMGGYGLTETSPVLTLAKPKGYLDLPEQHRYQLQAMTGYPIPGVELKIVDGSDRELPWDGEAVGEVMVRGDMVMKGYWERPEETSNAFRGGWFCTGDMAKINPDGYVLIVDRRKDIIVSGGENISSLELEKTLLAHPAILECAVISVPDEQWGEVPRAIVVLRPGCKAIENELLDHCRERLAGFKVPHGIDFLDSLPKGGTGKILKRELREKYWQDEPKRVH